MTSETNIFFRFARLWNVTKSAEISIERYWSDYSMDFWRTGTLADRGGRSSLSRGGRIRREPDEGHRKASQRDCETKQGPPTKEGSLSVGFFHHETVGFRLEPAEEKGTLEAPILLYSQKKRYSFLYVLSCTAG